MAKNFDPLKGIIIKLSGSGENVDKELSLITDEFVEALKDEVPVQTGALRDSIESDSPQPGEFNVHIGEGLTYGPVVAKRDGFVERAKQRVLETASQRLMGAATRTVKEGQL